MKGKNKAKGKRKIPTSPLLKAIRRAKSLRGSKYSLSGNVKSGGHAPRPITLRRAPEKVLCADNSGEERDSLTLDDSSRFNRVVPDGGKTGTVAKKD